MLNLITTDCGGYYKIFKETTGITDDKDILLLTEAKEISLVNTNFWSYWDDELQCAFDEKEAAFDDVNYDSPGQMKNEFKENKVKEGSPVGYGEEGININLLGKTCIDCGVHITGPVVMCNNCVAKNLDWQLVSQSQSSQDMEQKTSPAFPTVNIPALPVNIPPLPATNEKRHESLESSEYYNLFEAPKPWEREESKSDDVHMDGPPDCCICRALLKDSDVLATYPCNHFAHFRCWERIRNGLFLKEQIDKPHIKMGEIVLACPECQKLCMASECEYN